MTTCGSHKANGEDKVGTNMDRRTDTPVHEAPLLLAVAPHPSGCLLVHGRIPVRVEEDKPVAADQVKPAPSGFAGWLRV